MRYNEEFFYGGYGYRNIKTDSFQITEDDLEKIKLLKSYISDESSYYDTMLMWRLQDNSHIKDMEELSRLFVGMQFISMLADIDPKLQEKHNLQKHHMALLRRLYLEFNDYDGDILGITMGCKRPFGNSHVLSDVKEEMDRYNGRHPIDDDEDEDDDNYEYDKEAKVLSEFTDFLSDFYKGGFELQWKNFVFQSKYTSRIIPSIVKIIPIEWGTVLTNREFRLHSYLDEWTLNPCEIRDKKIEIILK